jgi:hypothetical protein
VGSLAQAVIQLRMPRDEGKQIRFTLMAACEKPNTRAREAAGAGAVGED